MVTNQRGVRGVVTRLKGGLEGWLLIRRGLEGSLLERRGVRGVVTRKKGSKRGGY